MQKSLYLGLDLSTQRLTALVIDPLNKTLQQHGSVYLNQDAAAVLSNLDASRSLLA
jgi:sugar (pentulose or hexulose) kinase